MKIRSSQPGSLRAAAQRPEGFALVLVLGALVIVALLVIILFTSATMERRMAASNLDSQKTRGLAMMAVDDVVGKLRDNIPAKSAWGVAPGRLVYWNGTQWARQELYSGYSSGDRVALNVPSDAAGNYSLLSKNTDFPTPPPMDVDWVYVFEDGTTAATIGTTKRVTGRYAYWTDVETSKVNLNTAGKAQIDFKPKPSERHDMQNLSGHPSSVDLSKLDSMTPALSLATYEQAGISAERDYINDKDFHMGSNPAPPVGRFSSPLEWKRVVGSEIYEKNKFDLTIQGRAPEYSPWGQNRIWLNRSLVVGNVENSYTFDKFPPTGAAAFTYWRDAWDSLRFFVFPTYGLKDNWPTRDDGNRYFNWSDMMFPKRAQIEAMNNQWVAQFRRTDWPGFGSASFAKKWSGGGAETAEGQGEAECVAYSIIRAGDSMLSNNQGAIPLGSSISPFRSNDIDPYGASAQIGSGTASATNQKMVAWGLTSLNSAIDPSRAINATGRQPLLNEIGLRVSLSTNGHLDFTPGSTSGAPYEVPGFVPPPPAGKRNLEIAPFVEFWLPPGFAGAPVYINGGACTSFPSDYAHFIPHGLSDVATQSYTTLFTDIELTTNGTLNGAPVTYTHSWGYNDTYDKTQPMSYQVEHPGGQHVFINDSALHAPLLPSQNTAESMLSYIMLSPGYMIYSGPFDPDSPVSYVMRFHVTVRAMRNSDMESTDSLQGLMTVPAKYGDKLEIRGTLDPLDVVQDKSLEIDDPRLMSNKQAWVPSTAAFGSTLGGVNSIATTTSAYGDSSKLAYPDMTDAYLYGRQVQSNGPVIIYNKGEHMLSHSPINIVGAPNIGWMSVVSTGAYRNHPWSTLSLQPEKNGSTVPDWLILELMAMPYDQTYASHTEGKINLNESLYPWADTDPSLARRRPLAAVIGDRVSDSRRDVIVSNINTHTLASGAASFGLPSDVYVYSGQFCQIKGVSDTGSDDFSKEQLPREMIGLLTTQSADFKVHLVAQTLRQKLPGEKFTVTAETREAVSISRTNDFGDYGWKLDEDEQREVNTNAVPFVLDGANSDKLKRRIYTGDTLDSNGAGPDKILGTADDLRPLFRYNIDRIETLTP
ncbi:hypothetical protein BH09VER1_BH09VER1_36230 [soil metagenome]